MGYIKPVSGFVYLDVLPLSQKSWKLSNQVSLEYVCQTSLQLLSHSLLFMEQVCEKTFSYFYNSNKLIKQITQSFN